MFTGYNDGSARKITLSNIGHRISHLCNSIPINSSIRNPQSAIAKIRYLANLISICNQKKSRTNSETHLKPGEGTRPRCQKSPRVRPIKMSCLGSGALRFLLRLVLFASLFKFHWGVKVFKSTVPIGAENPVSGAKVVAQGDVNIKVGDLLQRNIRRAIH